MGWKDYTTEGRTAITPPYNMFYALIKAFNERILYVTPWGVPFTFAPGYLIPDDKRIDHYTMRIDVNGNLQDVPFCYYYDTVLDVLIRWWGLELIY